MFLSYTNVITIEEKIQERDLDKSDQLINKYLNEF